MRRMNALLLLSCATACFAPNQVQETDGADTEPGEVMSSSGGASGPSGDGTGPAGGSTGVDSSTSTGSSPTSTTSSDSGVDDTTSSSTGDESSTGVASDSQGETGDATDGGTEGETGNGTTCEGVCVASVPDGWTGPYLRSATPDVAGGGGCGGGYSTHVDAGVESVNGAAASCTCDCGSATGGSCDDDVDISFYDQSIVSGCTDDNFLYTDPASHEVDLINATGQQFGYRIAVSLPDVVSAPTCAPNSSESVSPLQTDGDLELCEGEPMGACESDGVCMPEAEAGFVAGHCILRDGENECPADSGYSERQVIYRGTVDTRSCSTCSCGAAEDVTCGGSIDTVVQYFFGGATINDAEPTVAAGTACSVPLAPDNDPSGGAQYFMEFNLDSEMPDSSGCSPAGGEPQGTAAGQDAFTVCCAP